jgi:NitT/TauT family transport system permease protein
MKSKAKGPEILKRVARVVLVFIVIFVIWEMISYYRIIDPFYISKPSAFLIDLWSMFQTGYIYGHIYITMYETILGLVAGVGTGLMAGVILAYSRAAYEITTPIFAAINAMPRIAIAPLFILWFGIGVLSKVALIWTTVFFIAFYNTFFGVKNVDRNLINACAVMGANQKQIIRFVIIPSLISWLLAALRPCVAMALVGAIVGEMLASSQGLGWILIYATGLFNITRLFSILILLALIGVGLDYCVRALEHKILKWRPS